jgi:hypothetical protein
MFGVPAPGTIHVCMDLLAFGKVYNNYISCSEIESKQIDVIIYTHGGYDN